MTNYNLKYIYNEEGKKEVKRWIKDYHRNEPLKVIKIANGTILPRIPAGSGHPYTWMGLGGVLDEEKKYVKLSGIKHIMENALVFGGEYPYDDSDVLDFAEEVVYIGPMFNHWGHFIYEFITRLWYCRENDNLRIAYCGWGFDEGVLHGSYGRFFELIGIDKSRLIDIRKPTRFKNVIIPEQCYLRNQYYTKVYMDMINLACSQIDSDRLMKADKIYFTRAAFIKHNGWHREHGEKVIQDTFAANGFKILDPAELTLDEQIFYMRNCHTFACIGSSTGADTVFMKPETDRIYIKKSFYMDTDLSQLDQVTRARNVTVVDCWLRPYKSFRAEHSSGPHLIGATRSFLRFLDDNGMRSLSKKIYRRNEEVTYCWFVCVKIIFSLLYPVYYNTLRKILRRGKGK